MGFIAHNVFVFINNFYVFFQIHLKGGVIVQDDEKEVLNNAFLIVERLNKMLDDFEDNAYDIVCNTLYKYEKCLKGDFDVNSYEGEVEIVIDDRCNMYFVPKNRTLSPEERMSLNYDMDRAGPVGYGLYEDKYACAPDVGYIWKYLKNHRHEKRFCAAVSLCASRNLTIKDAADYLLKAFPFLKEFNFNETTLQGLINTSRKVGDNWNYGSDKSVLYRIAIEDDMSQLMINRAYDGTATMTDYNSYFRSLLLNKQIEEVENNRRRLESGESDNCEYVFGLSDNYLDIIDESGDST